MSALNEAMPSQSASAHHIPIVDIFFPGFAGVSAVLQQLLSGTLDTYARLLCICGMLVFFGKFAFRNVGDFVTTYFTSKTEVQDPDEAYDMLESWVSTNDLAITACSSLASVDSKRGRVLGRLNSGTAEKKPLRFSPWKDRLLFRYKGRLLMLRCTQTESTFYPRKAMTVSCFGRSPQILRELLDECRFEYLKLAEDKTSVFEHQNGSWKRTTTWDIRPIETVVMNEELKQTLLNDVQLFLDPETRRWYTSRGIPYRRGYLLYGHPGTGKSSLSLSIAGYFGLDIYVLSLASINDSRLSALFGELPHRCVVLLEDVDAVGAVRSRDTDTDDSDSGSEVSRQTPKSQGTVSLSGLLNVLDGVASQEGRVLIMTTNHIGHLDKALIRPGRVDKKIEFQLADQEMARRLFRIVFEQSEREILDAERRAKSNETVRLLANEFAAKIPELELSPAKVLSFLLENRGSPSSAVAGVEEWISQTVASRMFREGDSWVYNDRE